MSCPGCLRLALLNPIIRIHPSVFIFQLQIMINRTLHVCVNRKWRDLLQQENSPVMDECIKGEIKAEMGAPQKSLACAQAPAQLLPGFPLTSASRRKLLLMLSWFGEAWANAEAQWDVL